MKRTIGMYLIILSLFIGASVITGCKGKSGSSGTAPVAAGDQPSFNISNASQLVALSNTVSATSSASSATKVMAALGLAEKPVFQYQIVNQGLSDSEVRARAKGSGTEVLRVRDTPTPTGTNLLSVDSSGNASLAINSNYLIKVMYSVTDPAGEYAYLALDTGFINPDGNDYSQFIAQTNCAFYRVKIVDNSFTCVMEGVYVQSIDDTYMSKVSGNQKPIQFDEAGNMYFPGTTFLRTCDDNGNCRLNTAAWNPRIYRLLNSDGSVMPLTQDNQRISYYLVLTTGEIAYQSITSGVGTAIYLWQPNSSPLVPYGTTINLTGTSGSIGFFTVDTFNTIMWGGNTDGIRFARPISSGVQKATLATNIFASQTTSSFPPRRIIVGDDGKLYGVFTETKSEVDPSVTTTTTYKYYTYYKVFQVLPYSAVPKVEIKVPQGLTFQPIILGGTTPFQVANGYFFYKETREKLGYGTFDVINMVNLNDRSQVTLLSSENTWYEIYNWRLRGNKLYFSALDLARTVVISGEIDTALVAENPNRPQGDYLAVNETASAIGATSRVQDIESLSALPTVDGTGAPTVQKIYVSGENLYSASIEFSKYMTRASVESNLTFSDLTNAKSVASMKVWIHKFMHMIPDLDDNGTTQQNDALLDLKGTTPLDYSTQYQIGLAAAATDTEGTALLSGESKTFKTRPKNRWYVSEDGVGRYAGPVAANSVEFYDMNVISGPSISSPPHNFRVQFKAKNNAWGGVGVVLYDTTETLESYYSTYQRYRNVIDFRWSNYPQAMYTYCGSIDAASGNCWWISNSYAYVNNSISQLFNGNYMYYRIDVYGTNFTASYSVDGTVFTPITLQYWDSNTGNYITSNIIPNLLERKDSHTYKLLLRVQPAIDIDDVKVITLNSDGSVGSTLINESFTGLTDPPAGDADNVLKLDAPIADPYGGLETYM